MRKLILFFLLLSGVAYGQTNNTTNTKFTNGVAVPNGATQKPTSGLTAGALSYVTGAGLYVYNGSAWELLGLSSGGVTSFNARTGVVVPEIGDYSSFYAPLTRSLTINGATQTLAADRTWTITANTPNNLTNGYGLTGGVFDGSVARTWVADTSSVGGLVSKLRLATNLTGYVKKATTITINGVTQDLSDNRIWTAGTVTSITPGYGLTPQTAITSTGGFAVDTLVLDTVYAKIGDVPTQYWQRSGTTLSPLTSGDNISTTGNITADSLKRTGGTGAQFLMGNGSTQDTTTIQTVANFFPKGDTRYLRSSQLGTSAISLGGTANGLSYSNGNYRLHKATATTGGVFTTGLDTIAGLKQFTGGVTISGGGLTTNAGLTSTGTGVSNALRSSNNSYTTEIGYTGGSSVGYIGTTGNGLIFAPSNLSTTFEITSSNTLKSSSLGSSGNVIVGADNNGTFGKIAIGSGLSLSAGTLTATGGSSGSVTTSGGTSGKIAKFTSASNIENSIMTEATNNITVNGSDGTEIVTLQGGGNDRFGFLYGSSLMQLYSKNSLGLRLGINSGTTGLQFLSGNVAAFNSDGVPLVVSSNNSNAYKLQLRDVTTTRGFIGANSTNAFIVGNNTGGSDLLTVNNSTGAVTASSFVGSLTGNASTATALQTARTISGVSFDGTANITLNNNAITNGAGYITASSSNTLTNKSGNISQWTNDVGYAIGSFSGYAPLASPAFTGTPTAPTQTQGDNSTKIATTAYVDALGGTILAAQKQIATTYTNISTSGTSEETLFFANIAQSNLSNDGDRIDFNFVGAFGLNASDKYVRISVGGNLIPISGNASNKSVWEIDGYLMRTSSTTFRIFIRRNVDYVYQTILGDYTVTDFNPLNFQILGQTNNASFPVTVQMGYLQARKAP